MLLFALTFALYLLTMPKTVGLEDDGAFTLAAWANGVAHPPGYPLFTLVGHLFSLLPWGTVAARVHAASAFFGAVGVVLLYLLACRLTIARWAALASAGVLACSSVYWSQAIVAEVYTLNVAFFLLLFLLGDDFRERGGRRRLALLAFCYGLSLANHWPLIGLSTPALLWLVAPRWREILRASWWAVPLAVLGLAPYLWMYWNSQRVAITFLGPLEGWRPLRYYVSREGYAGIDHQPAAGWSDKLAYAGFSLRLLAEQFSWVASAAALIGVVTWRRLLPPAVMGAMVLGLLGNTVVLAMLLGFEDDPLYHSVFRVYPLVAFSLAALWIGGGLCWLGERLRRWRVAAWGRYALAVLVVLATFVVNAPENFRQGDQWAEAYARALLESLPENAVLFLSADTDSGPVGYLRLIEGVRPDVTLYQMDGNLFPNRLFHPITTNQTERDRIVQQFVADADRPVFFAEVPQWGEDWERYWLYSRLMPAGFGKRINHLQGSPLYDYFERILSLPESRDPWTDMHRRLLIADMVPVVAGRAFLGTREPERDRRNLALATRRFEGKLALLEWLLVRDNERWWGLFEREARAAEARLGEAFTKRQRAALALLRARYYRLRKQPEQARAYYLRAMERWPAPANEAYREYRELMETGKRGGE
ncbi:hypothetical protein JCM17961_26640 [Endothiovibrio diazotrophicus]